MANAREVFYRNFKSVQAQLAGYFRGDYPAPLVLRLLGRRRRFYCTEYGVAQTRYHWSDARHVPTTADELRALLATPNYAGLHLVTRITSVTPAAAGSALLFETERELVFDLDLRDKREREHLCACDTKSSCRLCWVLVDLATLVLERLLGDALGPALVVFSGGKGAHVWFGNATARRLSPAARRGILALLKQGPPSEPDAPAWRAATDALLQRVQQAADADATLWPRLKRWARCDADAWAPFVASERRRAAQLAWTLAWPVPDEAVLTGDSHGIKVPFSVHDSTLRLALPLDAFHRRSCDPQRMPGLVCSSDTDRALFAQAVAAFAVWLDAIGLSCTAL